MSKVLSFKAQKKYPPSNPDVSPGKTRKSYLHMHNDSFMFYEMFSEQRLKTVTTQYSSIWKNNVGGAFHKKCKKQKKRIKPINDELFRLHYY